MQWHDLYFSTIDAQIMKGTYGKKEGSWDKPRKSWLVMIFSKKLDIEWLENDCHFFL